ncbi:hypothetical protein J7M28_05050 [bacterium]|nr:hypothetical protein [bacterium]
MLEVLSSLATLEFLLIAGAVCAGVFVLVFVLKLRPREIKVFVTIFAVGILAIMGMYVLTILEPSYAVFYAYIVIASATGVLLFIYYRYFSR